MDVVLEAMKCVQCRDTLSRPVTLPCGHSICKRHTETACKHIVCSKCGCRHENGEFAISEVISNMIKSQIASISFGNVHDESCKSRDELKKQLDANCEVLNDPSNFIHDSIDELKNRVLLKSERLKFQIDEIAQELLDDLDEYKSRCADKAKKVNSVPFKRANEEAKSKCQGWSATLNELRFNSKWTTIREECAALLVEIGEKLECYKLELLMNEKYERKKSRVEAFERFNIDIELEASEKELNVMLDECIDSIILDSKRSIDEFFDLIKFKFDKQKLRLLYRASRDGFRTLDFHRMCDNQANTVTIIKTTKGFVFGGYTQASWSSKNIYYFDTYFDTDAFLFSLVNPYYGRPFVCKIVNPFCAIRCSPVHGPTFGAGHDIYIGDEANANMLSSTHLCQSYRAPVHSGSRDGCYFCDCKYFQVQEIEIFQVPQKVPFNFTSIINKMQGT